MVLVVMMMKMMMVWVKTFQLLILLVILLLTQRLTFKCYDILVYLLFSSTCIPAHLM